MIIFLKPILQLFLKYQDMSRVVNVLIQNWQRNHVFGVIMVKLAFVVMKMVYVQL